MPDNNPETQKLLSELQENLKKVRLESDLQKKALLSFEAAGKEKDTIISQLQIAVTSLTQENLNLKKELEEKPKSRPAIKVEELARHLQTAVETLNSEAKQRSVTGRDQYMVDQFEVEIKGGIDVADGIRLVQLQAQELSPQSVSTVRFALRPVPSIKITEESQ